MLNNMVAVTMVFLVACGGDDGGGGGGGVDAPRMIDAPGGGGGCTSSPDNCTGENVCVNSSCVAAFPRVYSVRNIRVMLPTTDPDGAGWDAGGGAPDIFVNVYVAALVGTSPVVDNVFAATFPGPFDVSLVGGGTLTVEALDEDVTVNDVAVRCTANPITAANVRSRALACSATATTGSIAFDIAPK